ncbi:Hypothetical protein MVR_LOCUS198 [uncultured virus]|nr:Hypothetical protein MVR_LOCUS198 [uncultured virus]
MMLELWLITNRDTDRAMILEPGLFIDIAQSAAMVGDMMIEIGLIMGRAVDGATMVAL